MLGIVYDFIQVNDVFVVEELQNCDFSLYGLVSEFIFSNENLFELLLIHDFHRIYLFSVLIHALNYLCEFAPNKGD